MSAPALKQLTLKLNEVDEVIQRAVIAGDPFIASTFGLDLYHSVNIRGLSLAKLLYLMEENWDKFMMAGVQEEFEDFADANMGLTLQTVRKYVKVWKSIFANEDLPEETRKLLYLSPIKKLLLIAPSVEEGSLSNDDLAEVALLDEYETRQVVKKARGGEGRTSSSSAITGFVQVLDGRHPKGTLLAHQDGEWEVIGELNLNATTPFGKALVARIINAAGILDQR